MRTEAPRQAAFLVTSGDRSLAISWQQFTDDIDLVATLVRRKAPGVRIAVLGENSYEWIVAHAAILFAGATVVPIDPALTPAEIAERLAFVGATVLVHSSLYAEKAAATSKLMSGLMIGGFGTTKTDRFLDEIRRTQTAAESIWASTGVDASKTSMIVFTSGTTSTPRGVELTIRAVETFCEAWKPVLDMRSGDHSLMLLPLHHIFGLSTTYDMLVSGVALGVCPDFRRVYDAVERFRVRFLFLVPALADILAAKIEQRGKSAAEALGAPLDWLLAGGAPLSRKTFDRLRRLGVPLLTGYGLTETAALYSAAPCGRDPHVGSAGKAVVHPEVETRVSADGELLIRGPNVLLRYYNDPEATRRVLDADGWFHTGDVGRIDADGYVWISGRASRTIVLSSGKKIAPEELEEKLLAVPGVAEALVTGDGLTREIRAEIYPTAPEATVREAIGLMNLQLPVYKRISRIVMRAMPFPRTTSGKIMLERKSPTSASVPPRRRLRRGWFGVAASFAMLLLGAATIWISHALPDVVRLSDRSLTARELWRCRLAEEIGEGLIALGVLLLIVLAWRVMRTWLERNRP